MTLCILTGDDHLVVALRVLVHRVDGLFTDAGQVDSRPIIEHLTGDVSAVDHAASGLTEVIE